ncbi:MAG: hypothetical protein M0T75_05725 [Chloroflexi bacterium]|nr:hypothetical protein [Chloroflexota bacterium]
MNRTVSRIGGWAAVLLLAAACSGAGATTAPSSAPPAATPVPVATSAAADSSASPTMAAATMTIIISGDACTYEGPSSIPYGPFAATWTIDDTRYLEYGLFVLAVPGGQTDAEVRAAAVVGAPLEDPPAWMTLLSVYPYGSPATTEVFRRDLRQMAAYHRGPIYIACARPDRLLGLFGPIAVEQ